MTFKIPQNQVGEVLVRLTGTEPTSRMADRYRQRGDFLAAPGHGQKPTDELVSITDLRKRAKNVADHWDDHRPRPGSDHLLRREVDWNSHAVLRSLTESRLKEVLAEIKDGYPKQLLRI